ncbi:MULTISPECIES: phage major tail tube protein [unclassified Sphingomonas]|uniref:phage major tail tube protein n=1 Tax=unclassified Sphingomonas TaxID=196159 RepID=UPI00226A320D|nr:MULTISPECIES: phage major tail tube protein [unclassified Sphingomonas]
MALPRKLKNLMLFNAGNAYLGEVASFTAPKLARKMEEWRGGGMDGPVKIDMGSEALEAEWSCGGPMRDVIRQFGVIDATGVQLRFVGAYQHDDSGDVDAIEIVIRGRHEEIDMGEQKVGDAGEFKVKTAIAYYQLTWNGVVEIEIDLLGMVFVVGGIDRLAEIRDALGI